MGIPTNGDRHLKIRCKKCGQKRKAPPGTEGSEIICTNCGRSIAVPYPFGDPRSKPRTLAVVLHEKDAIRVHRAKPRKQTEEPPKDTPMP